VGVNLIGETREKVIWWGISDGTGSRNSNIKAGKSDRKGSRKSITERLNLKEQAAKSVILWGYI